MSADCKIFVTSCQQWRKTWLVQTQVWQDFHGFQLRVRIGAWKIRQIQEFFCLRDFALSSDPTQRSAPQTAKKPFSLKSHFTRWLLPLWRGSQLDTELILSWYYLTISWHKTALRRRPACGGWWRWHWNTRLCMIVIMVRGNLTLLLRKPQLLAP